ncbi:hypothetical protein AN221_17240 [Streptomyces nanshensis]|uniref:Uncharacterized protein n=1 Tax=Streptomyces nanshensis TaxID=518642 RepID=A0A1E7LTJ9_9ACTN|nr:hypothetical protein AN221_17240 [Streptomyces nanshensis]
MRIVGRCAQLQVGGCLARRTGGAGVPPRGWTVMGEVLQGRADQPLGHQVISRGWACALGYLGQVVRAWQ